MPPSAAELLRRDTAEMRRKRSTNSKRASSRIRFGNIKDSVATGTMIVYIREKLEFRFVGRRAGNTWQASRARFSLASPSGKFSTTASRYPASQRLYGSHKDLN